MTEESSDWPVEWHRIQWFEKNILSAHPNISNYKRRAGILFNLERKKQRDSLVAMCCYEYTMGITSVQRALADFGHLNIIHIGGGWCGYTYEATEFCLEAKIGLYVSNEMRGALWQDDYWRYSQKDSDGNPVRYYRSA